MTALTAQRLRELVHYDPETGVFTRLTDRGGHKAGEVMGAPMSRGYLSIGVDKKRYLSHRLAWLYVHGEWPEVIDHINGERTDNRIANLRNVTQAINLQNFRKPGRANTSGFLGVHRKRDRWTASVSLNNRQVRLGTFETKEAAHAAYVAAKRELHPGSML